MLSSDHTRTHIGDPRLLLLLRIVGDGIVLACVFLIVINIRLYYQYVVERVQASPALMQAGVSAEAIALLRSVVRRFGELCFLGLSIVLLLRSNERTAIVLAVTWALMGASINPHRAVRELRKGRVKVINWANMGAEMLNTK